MPISITSHTFSMSKKIPAIENGLGNFKLCGQTVIRPVYKNYTLVSEIMESLCFKFFVSIFFILINGF